MKYLSRPLILAMSLAAFLIISDTAYAQDHAQIFCSDCRDPNVHPSDFGNSAFNAARQANNGFTFDDLDMIEVINPAGQWAWINLAFEMLTIDIGFDIPTFVVPTGNIVIEVTDANGRLTSYAIDLEVPNELAVGTGTGPGYNPEGGNDASASGDATSGGWSGDWGDYGDYWEGWENGYGGQLPRNCVADFSNPYVTTTICSVP